MHQSRPAMGYRAKLEKDKKQDLGTNIMTGSIIPQVRANSRPIMTKAGKQANEPSNKDATTSTLARHPKNRSMSQAAGKKRLAPLPTPVVPSPSKPLETPIKRLRMRQFTNTLPEIKPILLSRAKTSVIGSLEKDKTPSMSTANSNQSRITKKAKTMKPISKLKNNALNTCDEICEDSESSDDEKDDHKDRGSLQTIPRLKTVGRNCTTFAQWKQRNSISSNQKVKNNKCEVFIVSKSLNDIRDALLRRSWVENTDSNSSYYDFKWAIKSKDVIFSDMSNNQLVNHFSKNTMITTKSGLAKSLKKVNTFHDIDHDSFFPRCYNLKEEDELEDFQLEFKYSYVLQIKSGYRYPSTIS